MKKSIFKKIGGLFLGLAMAVGVGVAVGSNSEAVSVHAAGNTASITFTSADFSNLGSNNYASGAERSGSKTGTDGETYNLGSKYTTINDGWQWKASDGITYNKTEFPGRITNITVKQSGTARQFFVNGGTSECNSKTSGTSLGNKTSATMSWDIASGTDYTYFVIGRGSNAAKVTEVTVTFEVGSTKTVSSVSSSGQKTSFADGDKFSYGGTLTATYSDSSSSNVTPTSYKYGASGINPTSSGTAITTDTTLSYSTHNGKYIYVLYTESGTTVYTSYQITVSEPKTPASVSSFGQTTTFDSGDTFAYGGTLTATYADSTSKTVSPTSFKIGNAGINPTSAGATIVPGTTTLSSDDHNGKTVYVLYTENNTTVYTSYVITVNKISKITLDPTVTSSFPYQGITLTVTDGTLTNNTDYRVYKNQTMTIKSTVGDMAKIEFTYDSASYDGGGWSSAYTPNADTWTSPTANGEQARITKIIVTLASADPLVELDVSSATSVNMLDGDTDSTVKILAKNIDDYTAWALTFDEDGDTGLASSDYVTVVPGAFSNNVSTFAITAKKVGSTILNIQLDGTDCENTVEITIDQKPASITITHTDVYEKDNKLQLDLIAGGAYKQMTFSGKDIRGNKYAVAAADVTPSIQSGSSYVTVSGTRITPKSTAGQAVVTYKLNDLTSVCVDLTVNVVDDYIETVGTPTFATDLTDTQGQSPTVSVFTSRPGTLYSGSSTTIPFENFKFSYDTTYASAQYGSVFTYDFSHGTTVDSTHKSQTIYVFCDIDEAAHGSYTITVEKFNDPLTAITFTNVTNNAVDVTRGNSFQLEWAYTPTNPTDGKEVDFIIGDNSDGIDITVSELGLISIGASSDLGDASVIIKSTHDDSIQDYVVVSAVLGTMKYTVSEAESWTKVTDDSTLSAGDVIMVASDAKGKVLGEFTGSNKYANEGTAEFSDGSASDVTGALEFTLETGSSSGTWKLKNGTKYLYGTNTKTTLCLSDTATNVTITISSGNATIDFGNSCRILHNVNSTRFSNYTSDASSTMLLPQIYLKSGGDVEMDVTETLFNGVHNNFGTGKTYEWDASCSNFGDEAWFKACKALKSITDYSNYKLNRAVANISGNEIEVFLAKYDAIIGKFGTIHDYLDRFAQGGINHGVRSGVSPLVNIIGENTNTVAIIVIISMVSVTAIGGYFFYRKRKEI